MFCSRCGSKLMNNALFCSNCGAKVGGDTDLTQKSQSVVSKELDRAALRIYLGDVLALECIVNQFSKKASNQTYEIQRMINNNYYQFYVIDPHLPTGFYFFYDGEIFYVLTKENGYELVGWKDNEVIWTPAENILQNINEKYIWEDFNCVHYSGFFESKKQRKILKEQFLNNYADFSQKAPTEYEKNVHIISKLKKENEILCKEWNEAYTLLQGLYQINIIPESFRHNLYAIFYLHSFVTTSNLSFETALLHYNLEEIKAKLDKVIEQQQEIIINQAKMISQNQTICEQNHRQLEKLEKLANIENNTYIAAQYAEIAAKNAEATAWIGLANYIGK